MRISDWSSDVCSSDLANRGDRRVERLGQRVIPAEAVQPCRAAGSGVGLPGAGRFALGGKGGYLVGTEQMIVDADFVEIAATHEAVAALHLKRRDDPPRSEERRVGKECVSTCRSRWSLEA